MELRPCLPGQKYSGPVRVPVTRSSGAHMVPGVTYRPRRRFFHLRSADYEEKLKQSQQMADERRAERKAEQARIAIYGPDISTLDEDGFQIDATCKVLKTIEHEGNVRLYYRRQVQFHTGF